MGESIKQENREEAAVTEVVAEGDSSGEPVSDEALEAATLEAATESMTRAKADETTDASEDGSETEAESETKVQAAEAPELKDGPATAEIDAEESTEEPEAVTADDTTGAEVEKKPKQKKAEPKTPLDELQPGAEITGRVVGIADFGAFVDIGAETDGLVHISELSEDRVKKVSDVVSVGQKVGVWIKDVDPDQERISLSMRSKPQFRLRDLKPEMVVEGEVTGIRDYGVFVDIGSETEGLVHVSEMAEGYVNKPSEIVSVGDDVEVRVKKIDRRRRRISLSMKGLRSSAPPPPQQQDEAMPTAMELAMRRALGDLEDEIEESTDSDEEAAGDEAERDELGDVFNRMLREYREDREEEA